MAERLRPRLSAREGRRFGLTVGSGFLALAALAWWRQRFALGGALAVLGCGFVAAALLIPGRLGTVERAWMLLAHTLSRVTTPLVMAALYFGLITPIGWLRRLFGQNPIVHRQTASGYWKLRVARDRRSRMERQF